MVKRYRKMSLPLDQGGRKPSSAAVPLLRRKHFQYEERTTTIIFFFGNLKFLDICLKLMKYKRQFLKEISNISQISKIAFTLLNLFGSRRMRPLRSIS